MYIDEIPAMIQWHEGLMLTQQHFQQASLRNEMLMQYHLYKVSPFHWGVYQLKYDPGSLVAGIFRVLDLEAIMPDSLLVSYHSNSADNLEIDLNPYLEDIKEKALTINIVVPIRNIDQLNKDLSRYVAYEGMPVTDENTGDNEVQIYRLKPRLKLLVDENPSAKYTAFPLIKVKYINGSFVASEYIPPMLNVATQSQLGSLCSNVIKRLREKALFLADQAQAISTNSSIPMGLEAKNLVYRLVSALPTFEALLITGQSHPYQLYLGLCTIVGQLAGIGAGLIPPVFSAYNHNDLLATFEQATEYIFRVLTEGVTENYKVVRFRYENNVFSAFFEGEWQNKRLLLGMRAQEGVTERELVIWGQECLIGSRTKMKLLRETRILGAGRQKIDRDEELIPVKGVMLFALRGDSEFIEPNEVLQIFNSAERSGTRPPAEIVMYVMRAS